MTISAARHVIAVPDLAASQAFYRDVLGFRIVEVGDPGWRFYQLGEAIIMAGECADAIAPAELGDHSYFAYFEIDDIDAYFEAVRSAGAKIIKPVRNEPWNTREFAIRTIDGHRIMFGAKIDT